MTRMLVVQNSDMNASITEQWQELLEVHNSDKNVTEWWQELLEVQSSAWNIVQWAYLRINIGTVLGGNHIEYNKSQIKNKIYTLPI